MGRKESVSVTGETGIEKQKGLQTKTSCLFCGGLIPVVEYFCWTVFEDSARGSTTGECGGRNV